MSSMSECDRFRLGVLQDRGTTIVGGSTYVIVVPLAFDGKPVPRPPSTTRATSSPPILASVPTGRWGGLFAPHVGGCHGEEVFDTRSRRRGYVVSG